MNRRWLQVAHRLPGRTRLRSPMLRRDPAACARLADALVAIAGVREVRVRPYTGSALVLHDTHVTAELLVDTTRSVLDGADVLQPGERPPAEAQVPPFSSLARKLVQAVHEIDRDIRRGSDGTVDLGTLATLGFLGAGALEVAATGKLPLPPWFNLAWWGFRTFITAEQDEILAERDGPKHEE